MKLGDEERDWTLGDLDAGYIGRPIALDLVLDKKLRGVVDIILRLGDWLSRDGNSSFRGLYEGPSKPVLTCLL